MTCSFKDVYENSIENTGCISNFGFDSPYSQQSSANSLVGKHTGGQLTQLYPAKPNYYSSVPKVWYSTDRMFTNPGVYDNEYSDHLCKNNMVLKDEETGQKVEVDAEITEATPGEEAGYVKPSADDQSIATQQPVENEDGTISVATSEGGMEDNKELESFVYGGYLTKNARTSQLGKFKPKSDGIYRAPSKRVQMKEGYTHNEIDGLRDSQYITSAERFGNLPLQNKADQDQMAALSIVAIAICCVILTFLIIKTFKLCCRAKVQQVQQLSLPSYTPPPPSKVEEEDLEKQKQTGGWDRAISGGYKSNKLSGSIF